MLKTLLDLHSSDNTQLILSVAACLGVAGVIARIYLAKSGALPLPPSPSTWRLRGHFLPLENPFLTIAGWVDEHGPLVTIRAGPEKIVIIGRYKAAVDIMEKQGALTADRPRMIAAGEILFGGLSIGLTHAGDRLRRMRRALHSHLNPKAAEAYQPLQMSLAKKMVLDLLDDPNNFHNHASTFSAAMVLEITYGKNSAANTEVKEICDFLETRSMAIRPGAYLVDSIPWLRYLPWYGQELKREFERGDRIYTGLMNHVKQQLQSKVDIGPSFARYVLENEHVHGLTEPEMAFLAGTFFGAGSDTTAAAMSTVLMAAACFPEEQSKVQAELNGVIGRRQAPTFVDQASLPQLDAFISEALRWRPLSPNGFPHRATKDMIWGNHCIPAGTTIFGNHWAISRDPDVYPEPDAFKPQRWFNDQGRLRNDINFFVYGFGRRICPGQYLANKSLFITSALILWAFQLNMDTTQPLDDMGFMSGVMPSERPCTITFKLRVPETELRRMMQR